MKTIILMCAVCLHLGDSYGSEDTDGVGAFAYDGPSGRYGGTYGLRNGQVVNQQGTFPPNFSPPGFLDLDDIFPEYFSNFGNLLQETFDSVENQRLAYDAATKAFELTTNRAGYNPYFAPSRFPFGGNFPGLNGFAGGSGSQGQGFPGIDMSNFGRGSGVDSAYAGAAIGPDYTHQVAEINPANPNNPNINKFSKFSGQPSGGYKSVSSSAHSSTSNINGERSSSRRAETVVNDNGVITKYKVES